MTDADLLRLACQPCRWRPAAGLPMGIVAAHFETEHPEMVTDDGGPDVRLDMVVVCPRCDLEVAESSRRDGDGWTEYLHDCPRCHRTYRIKAGS